MSKLIALLSAGSGTVVVSVGGFYLVKNSSSGEADGTEGAQGEAVAPKELTFKSVEEFKQQGHTKSTCVKDLFQGEFDDSKTQGATDLDASNNFFSSSSISASDPYKSCVIIDWKREDYESDKGKGTFTGTWAFVRGNEGFVNFNIAETSSTDTEKKLEFKGLFYLLDKKSSTNKWEVKHKKEIKENPKQTSESNKVDQYFPKKGTEITVENVADDYGGFFKDVSNEQQKLQHICGANECQDASKMAPTSKRIELSGTGDSSDNAGNKVLKDGSKDLNWGSGIYDGSSWSLDSKISSFKGTGKEVKTTPQETQ